MWKFKGVREQREKEKLQINILMDSFVTKSSREREKQNVDKSDYINRHYIAVRRNVVLTLKPCRPSVMDVV